MEGKRSLSLFRIGLILLRSYRNGVDRRVFRDSFEEPSMLIRSKTETKDDRFSNRYFRPSIKWIDLIPFLFETAINYIN